MPEDSGPGDGDVRSHPLGALAQTYVPRTPGSTANTPDRPAPDTPIPSYYQASYQAYLKMKADAHGGTQYTKATYSKMPDWSGIWSRDLSKGLQFDAKQKGNGFNVPLGPITADLTPRYKAALDAKLREVAAGMTSRSSTARTSQSRSSVRSSMRWACSTRPIPER